MLTTLISALLLAQVPGKEPSSQAAPPTAVSIVQKMLAHYASAKTISGTISMVQTAANVSVKITTQLAFDRETTRLYIDQVRQSSEPRRYLTVSDGRLFSYDKPDGVIGTDRFKEFVNQHGKTQAVTDLYAAARAGLGDQNAIMDIAVGRQIDLKMIMGQWVSMKIHSRVDIDGVPTTAIVGDYAHFPLQPPSGAFEAYVNDNFDLVRYCTRQSVGVPTGAKDVNGQNLTQPVIITTIWNSNLAIDKPLDDALFKVP